MNNPLFKHPSFELPLNWMVRNFNTTYLLVGDYLNRWNELIFSESDMSVAAEKSEQQGLDFCNTLVHQFECIPPPSQILLWKPLLHWPEFETCAQEINLAFKHNSEFRDSLNASAESFIQTQINKGATPIVGYQKAFEYSQMYLLEELAVFSLLAKNTINIQIYPGTQLPILSQISKIDPEHIPKSLLESKFIELRIKKK
ncbi:MAG: hypothetical protein RIS47_248, partial [Bacteroidota bacterium]|jgi:tRNA-dependent cyclodipeptide synthase